MALEILAHHREHRVHRVLLIILLPKERDKDGDIKLHVSLYDLNELHG